ncbi:hypothetical protein FZEAL_8896, partial [Fusarium zealandicum]
MRYESPSITNNPQNHIPPLIQQPQRLLTLPPDKPIPITPQHNPDRNNPPPLGNTTSSQHIHEHLAPLPHITQLLAVYHLQRPPRPPRRRLPVF